MSFVVFILNKLEHNILACTSTWHVQQTNKSRANKSAPSAQAQLLDRLAVAI
jgi:hypothetical protein